MIVQRVENPISTKIFIEKTSKTIKRHLLNVTNITCGLKCIYEEILY